MVYRHKTNRRLFLACAAVVAMLVVWWCMIPAVTAEGDDGNIGFGDYIVDVDIKKVEWNGTETSVDGDTPLEVGQGVKVDITYALPAGTLDADHNTITYTIPEGYFELTEEQDGLVYDENQQPVGTYHITKDGTITITFNDEYVQKNQSDAVRGTVRYDGKIIADNQSSEDQQIEIDFGTVKKDLTIKGTGEDDSPNDVNVVKSHSSLSLDPETGKWVITYTVAVSTKKGTGETVTIEDILGEGLSYKEGTVTVTDGNGGTITPTAGPTIDGSNMSLEIPGFEEGTVVYVTYQVEVDKPAAEGEYADTYGNEVTVTTPDAKEKKDEDHITVYPESQSRGKSGWYDSGKGIIHWKVELNKNGQDINGYEFDDDLKDYIDFPITVKEYDHATGAYIGEWTIDSSDSLPYTFSNAKPGVKYEIEYTTSVQHMSDLKYGDNKELKNTASLEKDGAKDDIVGSVWITRHVLSKQSRELLAVENPDGSISEEVRQLSWTSRLRDLIDNTVPAGAVYEDILDVPNGLWTTWELMQNIRLISGSGNVLQTGMTGAYFTLRLYDENGIEITDANAANANKIARFTVTFNQEIKAEALDLRLIYDTLIDTSGMESGTTRSYTNKASYEDSVGGKDETSASYTYQKKDLLEKWDNRTSSNEDSSHDLASIIQSDGNYYLEWTLIIRAEKNWTDDIIVTDHLPEGVTFDDAAGTAGIIEVGTYNNGKHSNNDWLNNIGQAGGLTVTQSGDGSNTVTFRIPATMYGASPYCVYITYRGKIGEEMLKKIASDGEVELTNEATMEIGDVKVSEKQSQTVKNNLLSKHYAGGTDEYGNAATGEDNLLYYEVLINPGKAKLTNDPSGMIIFEDRMAYSLANWDSKPTGFSFSETNLKLEKQLDDGSWVELGKEADFTWQLVTETETLDNGSRVMCYYLCLTIPDETALRLSYAYYARGNVSVTFNNEATLKGVNAAGDVNASESKSVQLNSSGATATVAGVSFKKVNADNYAIVVPGAEFRLEEWTPENGWQVKATIEKDETHDERQSYEGIVSDEEGKFSLRYLEENKPYRLVETKVPEGSNYLEADIYYFYVANTNADANQEDFPEGTPWRDGYPADFDISGYHQIAPENMQSNWIPEPVAVETTFVKVDADTKLGLPGAEFALYAWDEETDSWILVNASLTSEADGKLTVRGLRYNRAYQLVETKAPAGYTMLQEPVYFYVPADNDQVYTLMLPTETEAEFTDPDGLYGAITVDDNAELAGTIENEQLHVSVRKEWNVPIGAEHPSEVIVKLYQTTIAPPSSTETHTVTRSSEGLDSWSAQIFDEVAVAANQKLIVTLRRDRYNGGNQEYQLSVDNPEYANVTYIETITDDSYIYDIYEISNVTGNVTLKTDLPNGSNWPFISSYSVEAAAVDFSTLGGTLIGTVTLSEQNNWQYEWTDLLSADAGGNAFYYYIIEETVNGYKASYSNDAQITAGEIVVTNTPDALSVIETVDVTVVKQWKDEDGDLTGNLPDSITVQLYRNGVPVTGMTKTLTADDDWTATWSGLAKYVDDTADPLVPYVYTVVEISIEIDGQTYTPEEAGYQVSYTDLAGASEPFVSEEDGTVVVINTLETQMPPIPDMIDVEVQKQWLSVNGGIMTDVPEGISITLQLYRAEVDAGEAAPSLSDTTLWTAVEGAEIVLTAADAADHEWKYTWTGLPAQSEDLSKDYYYCVKETAVKVTDGGDSVDVTGDYTVTQPEDAVHETTSDPLVVANRLKTKYSLEVKKVWKDADNNVITDAMTDDNAVTVELHRKTENSDETYTVDSQFVYEIHLNKSNDWTWSWSTDTADDLNLTLEAADTEGNPYIYYIVETAGADGYYVLYSSAGVTLQDRETVTLSVTNQTQYLLPETGGVGIIWYTVGGLMLMLAAAAWYMVSKNFRQGIARKSSK